MIQRHSIDMRFDDKIIGFVCLATYMSGNRKKNKKMWRFCICGQAPRIIDSINKNFVLCIVLYYE